MAQDTKLSPGEKYTTLPNRAKLSAELHPSQAFRFKLALVPPASNTHVIKKVDNSHFFIAPGHDPPNSYKLAEVLLQHRPVVEIIGDVLALDGRQLAG